MDSAVGPAAGRSSRKIDMSLARAGFQAASGPASGLSGQLLLQTSSFKKPGRPAWLAVTVTSHRGLARASGPGIPIRPSACRASGCGLAARPATRRSIPGLVDLKTSDSEVLEAALADSG